MSKQFRVCPDCEAHLDPGEACDCRQEGARKELIAAVLQMPEADCAELLELWGKRKAASVLEHRDGRAQQVLTDSVDASRLSEYGGNCKHETGT